MKLNTEILQRTIKELTDRLAGIDAERKILVQQIEAIKKMIGQGVTKRKARRFTVAQKKAQAARMKKYWANKKKR